MSTGPFRFSRNPIYLSMLLVHAGVAVFLNAPWILLATPLLAGALQAGSIRPEERYLEGKLGDTYRARVRRWT